MADAFYNAIRQDIEMIKNDTLSFGFQIQGLGSTRPSSIVFTCKDTPESSAPLFTANATQRSYDAASDTLTYSVRIPPTSTANVDVGRYFYDLQCNVASDIITLMKGRLTIDYQITT